MAQRQQNVIRRAIVQFAAAPAGPGPADNTPAGAMLRMIQKFTPQAGRHSAVVLPSGQTLNLLFAAPQQLVAYLVDPASIPRGDDAAGFGITGQLIVPRDPNNSAFFKMITNPGHAMNPRFMAYRDTLNVTLSGIDVVRNWINSL
jgi:hypothetical protein